VMSRAGASDILDAAGSATCLVLFHPRSVPTSYSLPTNSPIAAGVSRLRFTTSAQRVAGQSVNPRFVIFSVKKSLPLGHGRDGLVYPEAALLKIVSK